MGADDFEAYKADVVKFAKVFEAARQRGDLVVIDEHCATVPSDLFDRIEEAGKPGFVGLTMRHRRPMRLVSG